MNQICFCGTIGASQNFMKEFKHYWNFFKIFLLKVIMLYLWRHIKVWNNCQTSSNDQYKTVISVTFQIEKKIGFCINYQDVTESSGNEFNMKYCFLKSSFLQIELEIAQQYTLGEGHCLFVRGPNWAWGSHVADKNNNKKQFD